jgi:hypothetical protein
LALTDRSVRWLSGLRPVAGVLWLCLLALPWFLAIVSRSGSNFFAESVGHDLMSKVVSVQEAHGAPPGSYFVLFWVTFWPGATLAAMAVPSIWVARREKGAKFLLCWIVPAVDRAGTGGHQTAALSAAALSGDCDPDFRRRRSARAVAQSLAHARLCWWFVLPMLLGIGTIVVLVTFGRQLGCRPGRSWRLR